jgi:hypothetical protein
MMDIFSLVDLYYLFSVTIVAWLLNSGIKWEPIKRFKNYVTLFVAVVIGAAFISVDKYFGIQDVSRSYKVYTLTFLVAVVFYDYILKYLFGMVEKLKK